MQQKVDFNAPSVVFSGILLGTIGVLSFIVQPGLVQGFVGQLQLSEAAANELAFDEMLGVAIATFITSFAKSRVSWRLILALALSLSAFGNLASALLLQSEFLPMARFVTGIGEGAIISLSFTIVGLTSRTERNLAAYLVLLLTYGAFGLYLMPNAFAMIGLQGIFIIWAILTLCSLYTLKLIPRSSDEREIPIEQELDVNASLKVIALSGVLLFNLAVGITWANLFLIGIEINADEQAIANALLISQFVAILGALIPVFFEKRLGLFKPIMKTILGSAIAIALLLDKPGYLTFMISVCIFNFLWNYGLPFILSGVGSLDNKGSMISLAIALQMTGLGFGPFLAALVLGNDGSYFEIEVMIIVLFLLSALPLFYALLQSKKLSEDNNLVSEN